MKRIHDVWSKNKETIVTTVDPDKRCVEITVYLKEELKNGDSEVS